VRRLARPDELGRHLAENAARWEEILGEEGALALGIAGRMEAIAREWAAFQREVLAGSGLNYAELTVIGMLRTSPPDLRRSPSELRELVGQSSAGMTRILDKLEGRGLVRRVPHRRDGRRVDIVLRPRGAGLAERTYRRLLRAEKRLVAGLARRRAEVVCTGLDALLVSFATRRPRPAGP